AGYPWSLRLNGLGTRETVRIPARTREAVHPCEWADAASHRALVSSTPVINMSSLMDASTPRTFRAGSHGMNVQVLQPSSRLWPRGPRSRNARSMRCDQRSGSSRAWLSDEISFQSNMRYLQASVMNHGSARVHCIAPFEPKARRRRADAPRTRYAYAGETVRDLGAAIEPRDTLLASLGSRAFSRVQDVVAEGKGQVGSVVVGLRVARPALPVVGREVERPARGRIRVAVEGMRERDRDRLVKLPVSDHVEVHVGRVAVGA